MEIIKIFISSSFDENFSKGFLREREAIKERINKKDYLKDISLDKEEAKIAGSKQMSLEKLAESDLVILLISGVRYGKIRSPHEISLTHLEYREAIKLNKHILPYFFPISEQSEDYQEIEKFKNEVFTDDRAIAANIQNRLKKEYSEVLEYKTGHVIPNDKDKIEKMISLYCDALAQEILSDIESQKDKILRKLPIGVSFLEDLSDKNEYNKYLLKEKLPYFSRKDFKEKNKINSDFEIESDIYNYLKFDYGGIIITGQGGVGKTRLTRELGIKAQQENRVTYLISREFQGWDTLHLEEKKKYCLLFDDIETNKNFTENILQILDNKYKDIDIKLICSTRNSYFDRKDIPERFKKIELNINNKHEEMYQQFIIENIFAIINLNYLDYKTIATVPAYAVFVLLDIQKGRKPEFHNSTFKSYITERLRLTLKKESFADIDKRVFRFLCCLPIEELIISEDKDFDDKIIKPLESDKFIVYNDKKEKAVFEFSSHDTIMDELLITRLETENGRRLKKEIKEIFDYSIEYSKFENAFRTLDRVSKLLSINSEIFIELFQDYYLAEIRCEHMTDIFIKSAFLRDEEKLKFLMKNEILQETSDEYILLLSKAMKNTKVSSDSSLEIKFLFNNLLKSKTNILKEKFADRGNGSYLIPAFYKFFSSKEQSEYLSEFEFNIDDIALKWINQYGGFVSADFVLGSYLEHTKTPRKIKNNVIGWLSNNLYNANAGYLIKNYLKSEFTFLEDINYFILEILKDYSHKSYSHVLPSYLEKGGDFDLVKEGMVIWLKQNSTHIRYSRVLPSYLKKGGDFDLVKEGMVIWLKQNSTHISYSHVLQSYLEKGDFNLVKEDMAMWLNENHNNGSYSYLIQNYLDKGGDFELVKENMLVWLNKNNNNERYPIVIQKYINGEDFELLKENMVEWLNIHYNEKSYIYAIQSYLDKGGDFELVKESINRWLNENYYHRVETYKKMLNVYFNNFSFNKELTQLDNIQQLFHYISYLKHNKLKPYSKYLEQFCKIIDTVVLNYTCGQDSKVDLQYLFIVSKYLELSNLSSVIVSKILDDFKTYIKYDNYLLNMYNFEYFPLLRNYLDFTAFMSDEVSIKKIIASKYEEYILNSETITIKSLKNIYSEYKALEMTKSDVISKIENIIYNINLDSLNYEELKVYLQLIKNLENISLSHLEKYLISNCLNDNYLLISNYYLEQRGENQVVLDKFYDIFQSNNIMSHADLNLKNLSDFILKLQNLNITVPLKLIDEIVGIDKNNISIYINSNLSDQEKCTAIFKEFLLDKKISNGKLNTEFLPLIRIYFNKSKSVVHIKTELKKFIFDNSANSAIYKVIILYILYGGNENEFKNYFHSKTSTDIEKIIEEVKKYTEHENVKKLEVLQNIMKI